MSHLRLPALALAGALAMPHAATAACDIWLRNDTRYRMQVSIMDPVNDSLLAHRELPIGPQGVRAFLVAGEVHCNRVLRVDITLLLKPPVTVPVDANPIRLLGNPWQIRIAEHHLMPHLRMRPDRPSP